MKRSASSGALLGGAQVVFVVFVRCFCLVVLAAFCLWAQPLLCEAGGSGMLMPIRVGVVLKKLSTQIELPQGGVVVPETRRRRTLRVGRGTVYKVAAYRGKVFLNGKSMRTNSVAIRPWGDGNLRVDGRVYRGMVKCVVQGGNRITVVNVLAMDDYLKGVVPCEMSKSWPMEALKAQAVAARTYALFLALRNVTQPYDLTDTAQMYKGRAAERARPNKAVRSTQAVVIFFEGRLTPAYYHTVCGGYTENAGNVWKVHFSIPKPVRCKYCTGHRSYRWTSRIPLRKIQRYFERVGVDLGHVVKVKVSKVSTVGKRATELKIVGNDDVTFMRANDFRLKFGPNKIRSTLIDRFSIEGNSLVIRGRGWGHGVGLCQEGARVLANKGRDYVSILEFYYPGVKLFKVLEIADSV